MEKLLQGVEGWFEHLHEVARNKSDLAYIDPKSLVYYFMYHGADFGILHKPHPQSNFAGKLPSKRLYYAYVPNEEMIEKKDSLSIEEKISEVDTWFETFESVAKGNGELESPDLQLLREVLIHFGAELDPSKEGMETLSKVTNAPRRPGMDAVWGHEFMSNFNKWTTCWVDEYEANTGLKLPMLKKEIKPEESSNSKTGGMRHWLGELTSLVAGAITLEEYKEREEARLRNGYARSIGKKVEETSFLPEGKKFPGSIPPTYVEDAWAMVKSGIFRRESPDVVIPPLAN